jgi:hypothetical protein
MNDNRMPLKDHGAEKMTTGKSKYLVKVELFL